MDDLMRIRRLTTVTIVAAAGLVALTATSPAQQIDPILAAIKTMGVRELRSIRYGGFGTAYSVGPVSKSSETRSRVALESYEVDVNYETSAMRVQLTPAAQSQPQTVSGLQQQISLTPHGFFRAAVANGATSRRVALGTEVSFMLAGQRYFGIVDDKNLLDRVRTWIGNQMSGEMLVEVLYRDYEKVDDGLVFPMHIVQSQGGHVSLDVWLSSVKANN